MPEDVAASSDDSSSEDEASASEEDSSEEEESGAAVAIAAVAGFLTGLGCCCAGAAALRLRDGCCPPAACWGVPAATGLLAVPPAGLLTACACALRPERCPGARCTLTRSPSLMTSAALPGSTAKPSMISCSSSAPRTLRLNSSAILAARSPAVASPEGSRNLRSVGQEMNGKVMTPEILFLLSLRHRQGLEARRALPAFMQTCRIRCTDMHTPDEQPAYQHLCTTALASAPFGCTAFVNSSRNRADMAQILLLLTRLAVTPAPCDT